MKKPSKKVKRRETRKKTLPVKEAREESRARAKAAETAPVSSESSQEDGYEVDTLVGLEKNPKGPAGLQAGDLQGLSNRETVDSQSVDELLEEGNAREAGVVAGVEASKNAGTREVRTREVPVDDVPQEYLDED